MLSRRSFLTFAMGLLPCAPANAWSAPRAIRAAVDPAQLLSALVGDTNAAAAIGRDALSLYPDLLENRSLTQALEGLQVAADDGTPFDVVAVRARYQAALREDFAASRIIEVRGWQLAQTEVCLFALLAVESGSNRRGFFKVR